MDAQEMGLNLDIIVFVEVIIRCLDSLFGNWVWHVMRGNGLIREAMEGKMLGK